MKLRNDSIYFYTDFNKETSKIILEMKKLYYWVRNSIMRLRWYYFTFRGMKIDKTSKISLYARLDHAYPKGIHIGKYCYITGGCLILCHDFSRRIRTNTYIGDYCFIGMDTIILPGLHIGNHSIIGAGSVVTKDVPPHSIVAGNPAKVIKSNINTEKWGRIIIIQSPPHETHE